MQVTAGGLSHGLTPLQAANPNIHVFDEPAFYLGALWLPYRRDPTSLLDAISATPQAKAIFAHVDVVGRFRKQQPLSRCWFALSLNLPFHTFSQ